MKSSSNDLFIVRVVEALELVGEAGGRHPGRIPRNRIILHAMLLNMLISFPQLPRYPGMHVSD